MTDFIKSAKKVGESMSAVISAEMTAKAAEERAAQEQK